jgi:hypothetical protein
MISGARGVSLLEHVLTSCGSPPASYSMATMDYFPWPKVTEVDHAHLSNTQVMNMWSCTFAPSSCLHSMYRNNSTFVRQMRVAAAQMWCVSPNILTIKNDLRIWTHLLETFLYSSVPILFCCSHFLLLLNFDRLNSQVFLFTVQLIQFRF